MTGGPLKPIQVIPPGFTGLLQLKQEGRLPDMLSDLVSPVVELRDWYLTARRVNEVALFGGQPGLGPVPSGTTGSVGFSFGGVSAQVPQQQIWYVEQMSVRFSGIGVAATDLMKACCCLAPSVGGTEDVGIDVSDYLLAVRTRLQFAKADRGFWAFPGDTFAVDISDLVVGAGGLSAVLKLRATPCPI